MFKKKKSKEKHSIFFYQAIGVAILAIGLFVLNHFNEHYFEQIMAVITSAINTGENVLTVQDVFNANFQIEESILNQIEQNNEELASWER
ncbi:MAG: hypothetical protein FWF50_05410 [Defluviitaleaceae bacterium]|nr:hypothetical protein [Defluviitaleaceae bacterium]